MSPAVPSTTRLRGHLGRPAVRDCAVLAATVIATSAASVSRLGFYSDDWGALGIFTTSPDKSLFGLIREFLEKTPGRPIQAVNQAVLFWLFGLKPLLYHLENTLVFICAILLFYLCLTRIGLPRILTFTWPLVFALLPHYVTDRLWYAAFQANLSVALYFLSLYSGLRSISTSGARRAVWGAVAMASMLCSLLAYEVVAPFFLLNLPVLWYCGRRSASKPEATSRIYYLFSIFLPTVLALGLGFTYKVLFTDRTGVSGDYKAWVTWLARECYFFHYVTFGLELPAKVNHVLDTYFNPGLAIGAVAMGIALAMYLFPITGGSALASIRRVDWIKTIAVGFLLTGLGTSVFLYTENIGFSETGISTRMAIAASVGTALAFLGIIGLTSSLLHWAAPVRIAFCIAIAALCASGFLIINTVAHFWVEAAERQAEVISAVRQDFPSLPPKTTLILDGVCRYIGPGIVFETYWDVKGMLRVYYSDRTLDADVFTNTTEVKEDGIHTKMYDEVTVHSYEENLTVYNVRRRHSERIRNMDEGKRYVDTFGSDIHDCQPGREGAQAKIF
ncbi:MAG TPA: hypothetical protein VGG72_04350 [Bryobacteraceae bacterium]|jgi:hypothetical protein